MQKFASYCRRRSVRRRFAYPREIKIKLKFVYFKFKWILKYWKLKILKYWIYYSYINYNESFIAGYIAIFAMIQI